MKEKFAHAFHTGSLKQLKKLYRKYSCGWEMSDYYEAVRRGHLRLIKWLYRHDCRIQPNSTINIAVSSGHTSIVSFVIEDCACEICVHDDAFIMASLQGNFKLYEYLRRHGIPNPDGFVRCIEIAEMNGHTQLAAKVYQDFYDNGIRRPQGCKGGHCMCIKIDLSE